MHRNKKLSSTHRSAYFNLFDSQLCGQILVPCALKTCPVNLWLKWNRHSNHYVNVFSSQNHLPVKGLMKTNFKKLKYQTYYVWWEITIIKQKMKKRKMKTCDLEWKIISNEVELVIYFIISIWCKETFLWVN